MSLFERIMLKVLQDFQHLTAEEKSIHITLLKHQYVAWLIACLFIKSMIPSVIGIVLCVVNLAIYITCDGVIVGIVFFTTLPIIAFITTLYMIIMYKYIFKKQTGQEIEDWFIEKIQNLWLLNWKVISFKDWKIIKKRDKALYDYARSEECNNKCYFTSYELVNTLEDPDIKMLWICIQTTPEYKCGHSVIARNNKIYDSNFRRTYNREEYLKVFKAEIFKEYSIEEYMNKANLQQTYFNFWDWEEFGEWCKVRNAVRNN